MVRIKGWNKLQDTPGEVVYENIFTQNQVALVKFEGESRRDAFWSIEFVDVRNPARNTQLGAFETKNGAKKFAVRWMEKHTKA